MKPISKRTALSALLALSLSLLAACGSTPQATPDPIDDLATLADGEGNLEAIIEIQSIGSSALQAQAETVHLYFRATHKGKTVQGWSLGASNPTSLVSAALAAGDQMRIRGRVRKVGNVPVFIGLMRSQITGAGAAATNPPTPVILLAEGKTLPTSTQPVITLTDLPVSSFMVEIDGEYAGWLRTADGKSVVAVRVTSAREAGSGMATGVVFQAKLSGKVEPTQTPVGTIGALTGVLTYGQNKTVEVQGILTEMKLTDLD